MPARLAIVGDYDPAMFTHRAIDAALGHVRELRKQTLEWSWIATEALEHESQAQLADVDAVWLAPASPYRSMEGALAAVGTARRGGLPFLGVCGGFQHAVIEVARHVAGLRDADHAESNPAARVPVISALACSLVGQSGAVFLDPTSRTAAIYGRWRIIEQYHCSYGVNPRYRLAIEHAGLHVVGEDDQGDARVVELSGHPFFIATLFQPQLASALGSPAPLVRALVDAAIHHRDRRATPGSTEVVTASRR